VRRGDAADLRLEAGDLRFEATDCSQEAIEGHSVHKDITPDFHVSFEDCSQEGTFGAQTDVISADSLYAEIVVATSEDTEAIDRLPYYSAAMLGLSYCHRRGAIRSTNAVSKLTDTLDGLVVVATTEHAEAILGLSPDTVTAVRSDIATAILAMHPSAPITLAKYTEATRCIFASNRWHLF